MMDATTTLTCSATQHAYEIAKSINTSPTVDQNAKSILFGQDAKTVI